MDNNKYFRIKSTPGASENIISVNLNNKFTDMEILSLKITQEDAYKLHTSSYGVLVGRVIANDGFGIPNAKVSIFVKAKENNLNNKDEYVKDYLYPYLNTTIKREDGIRYNLLPDEVNKLCHQNIGTFPNKRFMLDNNLLIEIYNEYYKFTTTTNNAGDYMLFGVPTGSQTLHVDIDLSDIGVLSQKPRDMTYKGYSERQFDSPTMFKDSNNLDSLSQVYKQNTSVYIYPFWGDKNEGDIAISRADIDVQYKFEPTCIFLGSAFTDSVESTIAKNCKPYKRSGEMDKLITGEGTIEMVRETFDGSIEYFQINGNRLIDGNGTWCYQIPMNLDYMITDEYGNMIPTNNPNKGIPTRTNVRFRITLDALGDTSFSKRRGSYLVPNNPSNKKNLNLSFDNPNQTEDVMSESFKNLFWNKVYSIKSYIPRMQLGESNKTRAFSGIKTINKYGANNPIPYNNLFLKLPVAFSIICALTTLLVELITFINKFLIGALEHIGQIFMLIRNVFDKLGDPFKKIAKLAKKIPLVGRAIAIPFTVIYLAFYGLAWYFEQISKLFIIPCIKIGRGWCENDDKTYVPGCCDFPFPPLKKNCYSLRAARNAGEDISTSKNNIVRCVINQLANEYSVIHFDFYNDWVNGTLYMPLFQYKIKKKKKRSFLGLFGSKVIGETISFCGSNSDGSNAQDRIKGFLTGYKSINLVSGCDIGFSPNGIIKDLTGEEMTILNKISDNNKCQNKNCYQQTNHIPLNTGIVKQEINIEDDYFYYYQPSKFDTNEFDVIYLYATDIILLGGMNDCDIDGIPPLHQYIPSSTFNYPPDMVVTDSDDNTDDEFDPESTNNTSLGFHTEVSGVDWGLRGPEQDLLGKGGSDSGGPGGLFVGTECFRTFSYEKSCINAQRICELGVSIDESFDYYKECTLKHITPDGFISTDELLDSEVRQMFATLNSNNLIINKNNKYEFNYLYPESFDGKLSQLMRDLDSEIKPKWGIQKSKTKERFDVYYHHFRFGGVNNLKEEYYKGNNNRYAFPKFRNSFYFYFGLKSGQTAIDRFRNQFYTSCVNNSDEKFLLKILKIFDYTLCPCDENKVNKPLIHVNVQEAILPLTVQIVSKNTNINKTITNISKNDIYIGKNGNGIISDMDLLLLPGNYDIIVNDSNNNMVVKTVIINSINELSFNFDTINSLSSLQNGMNVDCNNYWGTQTYDESLVKGKIILHSFNINKLLEKGCDLNNYDLVIKRLSDNNISISNWNLQDKFNINGNIIIPVCIGDYDITITNKNCDEESITIFIQIKEPKKLDFYFNGININYFKNQIKNNIPSNEVYKYPNCTYGDYYWIKLYEELTLSINNKSNLLDYPKNSDGTDFDDTQIKLFNEEVRDSFISYCSSNNYINLKVENGVSPYIFYTVGDRDININNYLGEYINLPTVQPSNLDSYGTIAPYKTNLTIFDGEYIPYSELSSDINNVNFSTYQKPLGVQPSCSIHPQYCSNVELGGYHSVLIDNDGLGVGLPIGINDFIINKRNINPTYQLTLDDFNLIKNNYDNGDKTFSFFYHIIDKSIKIDQNNSIFSSPNLRYNYLHEGINNNLCNKGVYNGNLKILLMNGGNNENSIDGNFEFDINSIKINNIVSKVEDLPYYRHIIWKDFDVDNDITNYPSLEGDDFIFSISVANDNNCEILRKDYNLNLDIKIIEAKFNEGEDDLINITFEVENGKNNYNYFLIKCNNLEELKTSKNPEYVISEYYIQSQSCPNIDDLKNISDISYVETYNLEDNQISYNLDEKGIYYLIVIDGNNIRSFSQPIDARGNITMTDPILINQVEGGKLVDFSLINDKFLYSCVNEKYEFIIYESKHIEGEADNWVKIYENSSTGIINIKSLKLQDDYDLLITVKDVTGLIKYFYKRKLIVITDLDYLVFRFFWDDLNGKDLDTATTYINSDIILNDNTHLDNYVVGRDMNGSPINDTLELIQPFMRWSEDNENSGYESVYIDISTLKKDIYYNILPLELHIDLFANWFGKKLNGLLQFELTAYKGGIMEYNPLTFNFNNINGEEVFNTIISKSIYSCGIDNKVDYKNKYSKIGRIVYKKEIGEASILINKNDTGICNNLSLKSINDKNIKN